MSNKRATFFKPESVRAALAEHWRSFLTLAALLSGTPYAVGLTTAFVYAIGDVSVAILIQP